MYKIFINYLKFTLLLVAVICVIYPAALLAVNYFLPEDIKAGKLTFDDRYIYEGIVIKTDDPRYFHPRPSAAGHNPGLSGGSNKSPEDPDYLKMTAETASEYRKVNRYFNGLIPADAVTASGSGLDPDISVSNAVIQSSRISEAGKINREKVLELINSETEKGFLTGEFVNINRLNIKLFQIYKTQL